MLRHEVYENSELGKKVKDSIAKGHLVEDQIAIDLVEQEMKKKGDLILEGFPRNLYQAEKLKQMLEDYGKTIDVVLHFNVDDSVIYERLSGRRICPECDSIYHTKHLPPKKEGQCDYCTTPLILREDDSLEVIKTKLGEYHKKTEPLIDYFSDQGALYEVNANGSVLDMYYQVIESSVKFTTRSF